MCFHAFLQCLWINFSLILHTFQCISKISPYWSFRIRRDTYFYGLLLKIPVPKIKIYLQLYIQPYDWIKSMEWYPPLLFFLSCFSSFCFSCFSSLKHFCLAFGYLIVLQLQSESWIPGTVISIHLSIFP